MFLQLTSLFVSLITSFGMINALHGIHRKTTTLTESSSVTPKYGHLIFCYIIGKQTFNNPLVWNDLAKP